MTVFGDGPLDLRARFIASVQERGIRLCPTLAISWDALGFHESELMNLLSQCDNSETALRTESAALHVAVSGSLEEALASWLDDRADRVLISIGGTDPFGLCLASGPAEILRALREIRAAALYAFHRDAAKRSIVLSAITRGMEISLRPPDTNAEQIPDSPESTSTLWAIGPDTSEYIIPMDALFHPEDPLGAYLRADHGDEMESRILFGRMYNRVLLPDSPFQWVSVLAGVRNEELFLDEAGLRFGSAARELWRLAQASSLPQAYQTQPVARKADTGAAAFDGPALRQIIGEPGAPGRATGRALSMGEHSETGILVCDEISVQSAETADRALAIVELHGSGFGLGAIIAHIRGIPHVYAVAEGKHIPAGDPIHVDGSLGIITLIAQS